MHRIAFLFFVCFIVSGVPLAAQTHERPGSLLFLPDNSALISYHASDKEIKILNLQTWIEDSIHVLFEGGSAETHVVDIVATHDGTKMIVETERIYNARKNTRFFFFNNGLPQWTFETSLICYSLPDKKRLWTFINQGVHYEALLIPADDGTLCAVAHMGRNKVISLVSGKPTGNRSRLPNGNGRNILQSPSGHFVLFWAAPGYKTFNIRKSSKLKLWDFDKGTMIASKLVRGKGVWTAGFRNDERSVFLGSYDGSLREWSLNSGEVSLLPKGGHTIIELSISGSMDNLMALARSHWDDSLSVCSYPFMEPLFLAPAPGGDFIVGGGSPTHFSFSRDGKYFAFSQPGSTVIYRVGDWQCIRTVE